MMFIFLLISLAIVGFVALAAQHRTVRIFAAFYYLVQAGFAAAVIPFRIGDVESQFFTFDLLGAIFFVLMAVISAVAFVQSNFYLDRETLRQFKLYNISLMLLCVSATGVYFANNIAVTWIFLEATTLCTAGLVYHRRNTRSLEATWKYIFICSLGIAVAYLGILLLSTVTAGGELSYANLARTVASGNPLYLKIAFLFILVGYSCKMEVFPLYTIGVDANFAAPAPASAVISTVLVNAGFVSLFRVYRVAAASPVYEWFSHVLILAGLISLLIAGVYLRRTNNYKRFLAYSTVECMGLSVVGLGVGGIGIFAALLQVIAHALIKSGMFVQMAQVGKVYGTYRMNRIGGYIDVNRTGAVALLLGGMSLLAFPPSVLFVSEMMILRQVIESGRWWLLVLLALLLCFVMFSFCSRILKLCYKPVGNPLPMPSLRIHLGLTWCSLLLIAGASVLGIVQPPFLIKFINAVIAF